MAGFCESVCEKSADCSVSNAEELAKGGDQAADKTLASARAGRDALKQQCKDSCAQGSAERAEDVAAAQRAERCLEQDSCSGYVDCLRGAAVVSP